MRRAPVRLLVPALATVALLLLSGAGASAHAVLPVPGLHIAIGWEFEPASGSVTYVGQPNGVQVFVDTTGPGGTIGSAIGDLNADCSHPDFQVVVTYGGRSTSPLCPQSQFDADTARGRMDEYDAVITPTRVGDYTFHIFGTIHGTKVDQTVTSGPSTFDTVGDPNATEFPVAIPGTGDLSTKVDHVATQAGAAATSASQAMDSAGRGTALSIVALVVAVVVGIANVAIMARRRRT